RFARLREFKQNIAVTFHLVAAFALNFFLAPALGNFGFELLVGLDELNRAFSYPMLERYVQAKNFLFRLLLGRNIAGNCQQQWPTAGRQRRQDDIERKLAAVLTPRCPFKAVAPFG